MTYASSYPNQVKTREVYTIEIISIDCSMIKISWVQYAHNTVLLLPNQDFYFLKNKWIYFYFKALKEYRVKNLKILFMSAEKIYVEEIGEELNTIIWVTRGVCRQRSAPDTDQAHLDLGPIKFKCSIYFFIYVISCFWVQS